AASLDVQLFEHAIFQNADAALFGLGDVDQHLLLDRRPLRGCASAGGLAHFGRATADDLLLALGATTAAALRRTTLRLAIGDAAQSTWIIRFEVGRSCLGFHS